MLNDAFIDIVLGCSLPGASRVIGLKVKKTYNIKKVYKGPKNENIIICNHI